MYIYACIQVVFKVAKTHANKQSFFPKKVLKMLKIKGKKERYIKNNIHGLLVRHKPND